MLFKIPRSLPRDRTNVTGAGDCRHALMRLTDPAAFTPRVSDEHLWSGKAFALLGGPQCFGMDNHSYSQEDNWVSFQWSPYDPPTGYSQGMFEVDPELVQAQHLVCSPSQMWSHRESEHPEWPTSSPN